MKKRMKILEMMKGEIAELNDEREARANGEDLQYEKWVGTMEIKPVYPDSVELIMEVERQKEKYTTLIKSLFTRLLIDQTT